MRRRPNPLAPDVPALIAARIDALGGAGMTEDLAGSLLEARWTPDSYRVIRTLAEHLAALDVEDGALWATDHDAVETCQITLTECAEQATAAGAPSWDSLLPWLVAITGEPAENDDTDAADVWFEVREWGGWVRQWTDALGSLAGYAWPAGLSLP